MRSNDREYNSSTGVLSVMASLEKSRNPLQTGGWRRASFHARALATALQDARTATEPRRCRRPGKDCARNTSVQSCGHAGGPATERKVALCALRFQNRKIGCVANMTDRFSPVRGSEAVTRRDAVSVSTVDLAMPPPKRVVGHGQNCGLSEPSAGNVSDGIGTSQSKRESNFP
jgi:hypothetical protein